MADAQGIDTTNEMTYPTPYATSPLLPLLLLSMVSQKHSPTPSRIIRNEYDYVIVGAGSAGSVLANRLSEMNRVSVLLLEAGKSPPLLTDIPAISRSFFNTDIDWNYLTTPQRNTGASHKDRKIPWPSCRCLGGCSIFNAMLNVRGNRRNYDEWAELGAKGWCYKDVLPYFNKLEDNTDPEYAKEKYHGVGGPITISRPSFNPKLKQAATKAACSEGYEFVDPNGPEQEGFYDLQTTSRRGQRCSTAKGYLVPAENRTNLDIIPNAMVRKVLIRNKRAEGVEFDYDRLTRRVTAKREVILSAGTTNTAQLLMLSGIGPRRELQKHKIPVIADLPVGQTFLDHPASFLWFELNDTLPRFQDEIRKEVNILEYIHKKTGPLTSPEGHLLMSFLRNSNSTEENIPDHSVYIWDSDNVVPHQMNFNEEVLKKVVYPLANKNAIICGSQLLRTRSVGTVSLRSANPNDSPAIDPNFYGDIRDLEGVVDGLITCLKIMNNPAMKNLGAKPIDAVIPGCEECAADQELYSECVARHIAVTTNHQVGTAKMGDPKDPTTVVDPELRVKGIQRLRVVDASIMPTIPWGNTLIPTIMVAEKAADMIKSNCDCEKITIGVRI